MTVRYAVHSTKNNVGAVLPPLFTWLREAWQFNRTITVATLFSVALLPLVLLAMWLDPVTITGVNGWIKPFKFLVSSAIYTATLTWLLTYVQG
ncbi:MAG: hypothetical protein U0350_27875 [Caldilineaceae bacterium]